MKQDQPFVDYYVILEVSPKCDAKVLEAAYRRLLKIYHPDHAETANETQFNEVVEAYRKLRNPEDRAKYDTLHKKHVRTEDIESHSFNEALIAENAALTDAEAHEKILRALYKYRRENAQDPGVVAFYIKEFLECTDEIFDFHVWYLKSKGFIERTEQGTLAITVLGVDQVISMSRTSVAEQLLIAQPENS